MVDAGPRTDSSDLSLTSLGEGEVAALHAREGQAVVVREGSHWRAAYPGFFQRAHLLARMRAAEVRQPTRFCWGFRAALAEEDARLANAVLPVHLLGDVPHFDERQLSRNRRSDLRRCESQVEVQRLTTPELLLEQGYDPFRSAQRRLGHSGALTEAQYRARVLRRTDWRRLILAGLIGGALGGYLDSYAIQGVLYLEEIFIATEALHSGIGTGLYVGAIRAARRCGSIHTICNGIHRPERPSLSRFKEGLGFRVVCLPALAMIRAPLRAYLKRRRPLAYYRLTGDETVLAAAGASSAGMPSDE
jgi:hypothetical protein